MNQPEDKRNISASQLMIWGTLSVVWFLFLCFVPDARPLSAPQWAVQSVTKVVGCSEPAARLLATVLLRGVGFSLLGILLSLAFSKGKLAWSLPAALIVGPLLAVVTQWINYQYFPIYAQIQLSAIATITGVLIGFIFRGKKIAIALLLVFAVGIFAWGTSTGISDDLYEVAVATGLHLIEHESEIPKGDEGFEKLLQIAFSFAEDNSHRTDAVFTNKAAILALGVIVGEEKVAAVAKRRIEFVHIDTIKAIRTRVTLRNRNDLARHFCVSAALAVLSDEERSMTVGIAKELMDATPGGSGFSFVDLTADRAGTLFATAATKSPGSARRLQETILQSPSVANFFPEIDELPEGLSQVEFQQEYGGLGGEKTGLIVLEIQKRLSKCKWLK